MSRIVQCVKLGQQAEGLPRAPLPGVLGQRIFENVSKQAWADWVKHQTMLINEYRLNLAESKSRAFLTAEMEKYFFGGELAGTHFVPPEP